MTFDWPMIVVRCEALARAYNDPCDDASDTVLGSLLGRLLAALPAETQVEWRVRCTALNGRAFIDIASDEQDARRHARRVQRWGWTDVRVERRTVSSVETAWEASP
jgi:hypothetical protein